MWIGSHQISIVDIHFNVTIYDYGDSVSEGVGGFCPYCKIYRGQGVFPLKQKRVGMDSVWGYFVLHSNPQAIFFLLFRPIINNKFEDKICGDGPSLSTMFEDDKHLQKIIHSIRVSFISKC